MRRLTNTQIVQELMGFPRSGALMHAFVFQALSSFSEQVLLAPEGAFGDSLISAEAWRACASEVLENSNKKGCCDGDAD